MADTVRVEPLPARPSPDAPIVASAHTRVFVVGPAAPLPAGTDAVIELPDGQRFAYAPVAAGGEARTLAIDPFVRGNSFKPLHESERALAAQLSIAAGRRVETGPESERLLLVLRGAGLVFVENGDALRIEPNHVALIPAGEPARVWAQGPEDMLAIVFQPRGQQAKRRTLAGEIAKRRAPAT